MSRGAKTYTVNLVVRLTEEQDAKLAELQVRWGCSKSAALRRLIEGVSLDVEG